MSQERASTKTVAGDRELDLLSWVAEQGPVAVGQAASGFGEARGLARTTVQTMLERLRRKGLLRRRRQGGIFVYESPRSAAEIGRDLVRRLAQGPLGGSVSPFVAYLSEADELDEADLAELESLVERLRSSSEDNEP